MKSHRFCCHSFRKRLCRVLPKSKVYWFVGLALALTILVNIGEVSHHVRSRWLQTFAHSPHGESSNISDQFEVVNSFQIYVPDYQNVHEAGVGYLQDLNWSKYRRNLSTEVEVQKQDGSESAMNLSDVKVNQDGIVPNRRISSGEVQPVRDTPLKTLTPSSESSTSGPGAETTSLDKQTRRQDAMLRVRNLTAVTMESSGVVQQRISTAQPHPTAAHQPAATTTAATTEPATAFKQTRLGEKMERRNCSDVILNQLVGRFQPPMQEATEDDILDQIPDIQIGGNYEPMDCVSDEKTAIIIPYRDRWHHLHILLPVLLPMLIKQKVTFTLFIVAQDPPETFNKGLLFNAGFLEALKLGNFTCFILHDVDMIPADDRNLYRCDKKNPTHFGVSIDKFKFKLPYYGLFGGVTAFTREQFQRINGASNMYFGWGAEDDDLRERIFNKQYKMARKSPDTAVYYMVKHSQKEAGWEANSKRNLIFKMARQRQDIDGLNSVVYSTTSIKRLSLYTWINVGIDEAQVLQTVPLHLRGAATVQRRTRNADTQGIFSKFE